MIVRRERSDGLLKAKPDNLARRLIIRLGQVTHAEGPAHGGLDHLAAIDDRAVHVPDGEFESHTGPIRRFPA